MARIPPSNNAEPEPQGVPLNIPPVEVVVHLGGINVQKIPTSQGTVTLLQIPTPIGIMFTIKLDEDGVDYLTSSLRGIAVAKTPGLIIP